MATRKKTGLTQSEYRTNQTRNFVLLWADGDADPEDSRTKHIIEHFSKVISDVTLVRETSECIRIVKEINPAKCFIISSSNYAEEILESIHGLDHFESMFIYDKENSYDDESDQKWNKVKGRYTKFRTICERLKMTAEQVKQDDVMISFIKMDDDCVPDLNRLEPSFMYTGLLKEIILETKYEENSLKKIPQLFHEKYANQPTEIKLIDEFITDYKSENSIWWYTRECFTYKEVNRALRRLEADTIVDMGFFIHDLHKDIEKVHQQQLIDFGQQTFIVYRGQGLTEENFKKLQHSTGGLLGFNFFLSTSRTRDVSLQFAEARSKKPGNVGVLFVMTIDPTLELVPFADICRISYFKNENEILFSMHTIFRIGEIRLLSEKTNVYEVTLTLTSEDDPKLKGLKEYMRGHNRGVAEHRLAGVLMDMGDYNKAEEIYLTLLDKTNDESKKATCYHCLGLIKNTQGEYEEAIKYYRKSIDIQRQLPPGNDSELAKSYNCLGCVYANLKEYSNALLNYERSLGILEKIVPRYDPNLATGYANIGSIYNDLGEYFKALNSYKLSLEIMIKTLPDNHPDLATTYNNIGSAYVKMENYSEALLNYQISLEIRKRALPESHPDLAASYNNVASVYYYSEKYPEALEFFKKSLNIFEKTFPSQHPTILSVHDSIEIVNEYL